MSCPTCPENPAPGRSLFPMRKLHDRQSIDFMSERMRHAKKLCVSCSISNTCRDAHLCLVDDQMRWSKMQVCDDCLMYMENFKLR